ESEGQARLGAEGALQGVDRADGRRGRGGARGPAGGQGDPLQPRGRLSSLGHCKVCELEDFQDAGLRDLIREIFEPDREHFGGRFPDGREYRKYWEVAMTARAFREHGLLRDDARVLGVGAGHEATLYWLTKRTGQVVATDLYAADDPWSSTDSSAEMLTNPG